MSVSTIVHNILCAKVFCSIFLFKQCIQFFSIKAFQIHRTLLNLSQTSSEHVEASLSGMKNWMFQFGSWARFRSPPRSMCKRVHAYITGYYGIYAFTKLRHAVIRFGTKKIQNKYTFNGKCWQFVKCFEESLEVKVCGFIHTYVTA